MGLSAVRVSDIADRAGMTTGHVSYYFPLKSDLLRRAIEMSERALIDEAQAEMAQLDGAMEKLETLIDLSLADSPGDTGWLLWFQVWAEAGLDKSIADAHHSLDREWRTLLRSVIADGIANGSFTVDDADTAATALAGMLDGLSIQLALDAPDYSADRIRRVAVTAARSLLNPTA
ncbi:TetR/AcrR family transcriptional regulator [Brevibacterium sp. NPDC059310]|uniref:TetR/AcrR family transcriptional regulator n=1 Tax=Brevibacterium sp. NPDC059310 TaxID=3346802 RepID=UPI003672E8B3